MEALVSILSTWLGQPAESSPAMYVSVLQSLVSWDSSKNLSGMQQQVLKNRAQAESREKCKRADDQNHRDRAGT